MSKINHVPNVILLSILRFVCWSKICSCSRVCSKWLQIIHSPLTCNMFQRQFPTLITLKTFTTHDLNTSVFLNDNDEKMQICVVILSQNWSVVRCYDDGGKLLMQWSQNILIEKVATFESLICYSLSSHQIVLAKFPPFDSTMRWNCSQSIQDMALDDKYVYVIDLGSCYVYTHKGELCEWWLFESNAVISSEKMVVSNQEIFILSGDILVYSVTGVLKRKWSFQKWGLDFNGTVSGLATAQNKIYLSFLFGIVAVFSIQGDLLFKFALSNTSFGTLLAVKNEIYFADYSDCQIHHVKVIWKKT